MDRSRHDSVHPTTGLRRGQGWAEQTRAGRWQARPGKGQPSLGVFDTKHQAIAALLDYVPAGPSVTLSEYLDGFLRLKATTLNVRTIENYVWYSEKKIKPYLGDFYLHQLDQRAIRDWWIEISGTTGTFRHGERTDGKVTCSKVWRFLHMALDAADADGLIHHKITEPVRHAGREVSPERVLLSEQQVQAIVAQLPVEWRLVAIIAATCGLRFSEIVALRLSSIDYDRGLLRIRQATTETTSGVRSDGEPKGAGRRDVPLHPTVQSLIQDHIDQFVADSPNTRLFTTKNGTPLGRSNWSNQWRRAVDRAGLTHLRPAIGVHDLRHHLLTIASGRTHQLRDVMALAGHSTSSAAMRYQHRANSDLGHLAQPFPTHSQTEETP